MRSAETLRSIAAHFRKLSEQSDAIFASHLDELASEYERMARQFEPAIPPIAPEWRADLA